ncbi:NADP-dependent oxidoreductase [Chitinophaga sp. GCM10012297]|uniref:NADP-dependent oxidoreductase n=1 Tax=Chitinophaga chungangae TaxID=2821488 RepID=A0ABS3YI29_9BACT|nr:NADP-dependent oxidoreductase [Chitinophaga chungangae]MBO9154353.1 NADP-dependent oxidoreductase [Chitinophaga chungangae]
MKAVAVKEFKAIPQLLDVAEPAVKEGFIKIKIAAAGLNPFDWKTIDGILKDHMPHVFPLIIGADAAGVVVETGAGVTRFKTGDKVYGQVLHSPVGEGAYAEYVAVPETAPITKAPENVPLADAAAAPTAGMTAMQLIDKTGLRSGQTLLLIGATGGVGSFATQVAKIKGIKVIATVSSEAAAKRIKSLGASETIDYKKAPVEEQFPGGADALIDLVSDAAGFEKMSALVKRGGAALTTQFVADKTRLEEKGLHGGNFETKSTAASLDALRALIDSKEIVIPVDRRLSLAQAPAAIAESRERKSKGKTIIVIDETV